MLPIKHIDRSDAAHCSYIILHVYISVLARIEHSIINLLMHTRARYNYSLYHVYTSSGIHSNIDCLFHRYVTVISWNITAIYTRSER